MSGLGSLTPAELLALYAHAGKALKHLIISILYAMGIPI